MTIECKILNYEDREEIANIILSRPKMLLSENEVPNGFLDNLVYSESPYSNNRWLGLLDNNELDCIMYLNFWEELPTYSRVIFSKKKDNRKKIINTKLDVNMSKLFDFQLEYCENLGYNYHYSAVNYLKWIGYETVENSKLSRYFTDSLDIIPVGELSKSSLFRNRLIPRVYPIPIEILLYTLKPEFRNVSKS